MNEDWLITTLVLMVCWLAMGGLAVAYKRQLTRRYELVAENAAQQAACEAAEASARAQRLQEQRAWLAQILRQVEATTAVKLGYYLPKDPPDPPDPPVRVLSLVRRRPVDRVRS